MNKTKQKPLVPKLRFPEFREVCNWSYQELTSVAKRVTRRNSKNECTRVLTNSAEFGVVDQREYFDKDIANQNNLENYMIVEKGDYVYNPRVSSFAPVGPMSKNHISKGVMSPLYTVFRFYDSNNSFYEHYFKTSHWHSYLRAVSNTGARHDRMNISTDDFDALPLPKTNPVEQQKIADCLSSLDELISAQAKKIDGLKAHKKGLMQKLFPTQGQTTPQLRFPEFRESGEWELYPLGEVCKFVRGPFGGALKKDIFVEKGFAVYEQSHAIHGNLGKFRYFITEEKYKELIRFSVKANDLIMSCSGTMGKFAVLPDNFVKGVINQALLKLTVKLNFDISFVKNALEYPRNHEKLLSLSAGGAIKNVVGVGLLKATKLPFPEQLEQQKIADCLSSLDELISAHQQKLDTLKAHKKGLMQQLFPSIDEYSDE